MVHSIVLFIAFVLLAGYGNGNTIRDNAVNISAPEPIIIKPVAEADIQLNIVPSIVTLQRPSAGNPPRQCAGIGQACASHGDCCTSSCFGVLRTCIPNLGIALNIQIGRTDEPDATR